MAHTVPVPVTSTGSKLAPVPLWAWIGAVVGVLVLVGAGVATVYLHARTATLTDAAIMTDPWPAPDFMLTDQSGQSVQFSQFKGKPTALTFIYTNCPDVCPLIASNMHEAYRQLGQQASSVAMVAVSVDPERDTVDQIRQFSDARGLTDEWTFLTGSADQLSAVWTNYGILAQSDKPTTPAEQREAQGLVPQPGDIEHSAPVYLIDKSGNVQAAFPDDFTPDALVTDLRVLLSRS